MAPAWDELQYERLFRNSPPTQSYAPDRSAVAVLGRELGHSEGGIRAQWDHARSAVLGSTSAASEVLLGYLRRNGRLQRRRERPARQGNPALPLGRERFAQD